MKLHEVDVTRPDEEDVCDFSGVDIDGFIEGVVFDKTGKGTKEGDTLDKLTDKILRHFFGAASNEHAQGSKRKIRKMIRDAVGDPDAAEEMTQDLSETLDLLESLFFEMDNLLQIHPDQISMRVVDILEEIGEHLEQWNMGKSIDIVEMGKNNAN